MFGHAANRLHRCARGVGGAPRLTIFSEDARAMKPESYPWSTRARTARPYATPDTHTHWPTAVLHEICQPSQKIQNNISQNESTQLPESTSRSLDTPHMMALWGHWARSWAAAGAVGSRWSIQAAGVAARGCTHLTSGLFKRRSDTHCAAPALAVSPRSHPTIFGAKNPGFRSSIAIATNMPTTTRHAPTHGFFTIFATIANRRTCDDVGGC